MFPHNLGTVYRLYGAPKTRQIFLSFESGFCLESSEVPMSGRDGSLEKLGYDNWLDYLEI